MIVGCWNGDTVAGTVLIQTYRVVDGCVFPCGKEIVISLNVAGSVGRRWWKGGAAFSQACCISSHIVCSRQNETQAQTTLSGTKT